MRERIDVPDQEVTRCLSETFFLSSKRRPRSGSDHSKLVGGLFQKLLQRGLTPLPTIEVEREAIKNNGLGDWVEELPSSSPEIAFELKRSYRADLQAPHVLQVLTERGAFKLDGEFDQNAGREISLFDSDAEAQFLQKWIPEVFGPTAAHWFVPQANLDRLLEANGAVGDGDRRIDFLFSFPGADPLAIEIDGEEHLEQVTIDRKRDDALAGIGIKVVRVQNAEIWAGHGPGLDEVKEHCSKHLSNQTPIDSNQEKIVKAMEDCTHASKVQLAIAKAIQFGWLEGLDVWSFEVKGASKSVAASIIGSMQILSALDALYQTEVTPARVVMKIDENTCVYTRENEGIWQLEGGAPDATEPNLRIRLEPHVSPFQAVEGEANPDCPDIIIRPAFLPISIAVENSFAIGRKNIAEANVSEIDDALTVFLQQIFRKRKFRTLQCPSSDKLEPHLI